MTFTRPAPRPEPRPAPERAAPNGRDAMVDKERSITTAAGTRTSAAAPGSRRGRCRSAASSRPPACCRCCIVICIAFHYMTDGRFFTGAEHLDRRPAGLDQHGAGRRHDVRDPHRRHRPVGRLDPRGLGDGGA